MRSKILPRGGLRRFAVGCDHLCWGLVCGGLWWLHRRPRRQLGQQAAAVAESIEGRPGKGAAWMSRSAESPKRRNAETPKRRALICSKGGLATYCFWFSNRKTIVRTRPHSVIHSVFINLPPKLSSRRRRCRCRCRRRTSGSTHADIAQNHTPSGSRMRSSKS